MDGLMDISNMKEENWNRGKIEIEIEIKYILVLRINND